MKNPFLIILVILACSIFAFAQTETPKGPDWKIFTPENEEFSIETPVELTASVYQTRNPTEDTSRRYLNSIDGAYFFIFSDDPKKPAQYKYVLNFVYGQDQSGTDKSFAGVEAKKFEFADSVNFFHTILIVKGEKHFYVFQSARPKKILLLSVFSTVSNLTENLFLKNWLNPKMKKILIFLLTKKFNKM